MSLHSKFTVHALKKKKKRDGNVKMKMWTLVSTETKCSLRVRLDWAYFYWNWKHYSKIIFKCVNCIVGPIFNEKVIEKWNLWVYKQYTNALFTHWKSTNPALKKNNNKKRAETQTHCVSTQSKRYLTDSHFSKKHFV